MTNKEPLTVIITGSTRGIGYAIAKMFASKGANLVINGRSSISTVLIEELTKLGATVLPITGDVQYSNEAESLIIQAKEKFKKVDVLVNNAGITRDNLLLRMTSEEFDETIAVNLKGTFNTMKIASKIMLKQKSGTIINIASVVGLVGNVGQANYAASKAGVIGLTKSAAKELASRGITVNAIAPGFIASEMTEKLNESIKKEAIKQIPLKRFGEAEEIAEAVWFLSQQSYITGQVLTIDGGMVMNG
ncbi:3-oxoacyl-[acyl-carrier-protein] reductase [Lacticigenium naphthae]|uniref:3-oxoacyl-[acyl-carrier-protein] reductase n=1 Tax=Lacticigenium naphthae TaxID=515351 RepID=UPI0004206014|nr:3-oxoacyl-[acyl-carrier-protein] reductase [Lacticigenium naphthae]